jgi:uncharacterized protein (DUF488 family)
MNMRLFTIGYEGMDLQSFIDSLERAGVECVLDVRENPFSRKRGFSRGPLTHELEGRGFRYVHLKESGTPHCLRERLKCDGDFDKFVREMERYLDTQGAAIKRAYGYVSRMACCLMCYEKRVAECHRGIVARQIDAYAGNTLEVIHLQAE